MDSVFGPFIDGDAVICQICGVRFSSLGRRFKNGASSCPLPGSKMFKAQCSNSCGQKARNKKYAASLKADPAKKAQDIANRRKAEKQPHRVATAAAYRAANKDKQRERYERFWSDPEKAARTRAKQREYGMANRKEISRKDVEYRKRRKQADPAFRVITNLRNRVYAAVMAGRDGSKTISQVDLLGCTPQQLVEHLEAQFLPGMSWDNYGHKGWHVDHIKPVAAFDDPEDPACWHFTNYQPLWAEDNWAKSDTWEPAAA